MTSERTAKDVAANAIKSHRQTTIAIPQIPHHSTVGIPQIPDYLTTADLARITHEKEQTIRLRRMRGDGPAYRRVGKRALYDPRDVQAWLDAHRYTSTAQETVSRGSAAA